MSKTNENVIEHVSKEALDIKAHVTRELSRLEEPTDKFVRWWESKPFTFASGVLALAFMFLLGAWMF